LAKEEPIWKRSLLDLSAALFLIGGVVSLISIITMVPISVYPLRIIGAIGFALLILLIVGMICTIEAFECYSFASKRMLAKAGIRGIVVGAILLSLGLIGGPDLKTQMVIVSAALILIGGVINYIYRM